MSIREILAAGLAIGAGIVFFVAVIFVSMKGYDFIVDHSAPVVELRATVQAMQTQIAGQK